MISLACVIILIHAVVPHHHHDFDNSVCFVLHSVHHHDSHVGGSDSCDLNDGCCDDEKSPFELCKLQELLSCLVLSNREDDDFSLDHFSDFNLIVLCSLFNLDAPLVSGIFDSGLGHEQWFVYCEDFPNSSALRAPPVC